MVPQVEDTEGAEATFTVHIRLATVDLQAISGEDLRLLPGMTGRVEIYTDVLAHSH